MLGKVRFFTAVLARPKEGIVPGWESPFEVFTFNVTSRSEGRRHFSAESEQFGGSVIGVGNTHRGAVDDLVGGVVALLDAHRASGTYEEFVEDLLGHGQETPLLAAPPDYPTRPVETWLRSIVGTPEPPSSVQLAQPQRVPLSQTATGRA